MWKGNKLKQFLFVLFVLLTLGSCDKLLKRERVIGIQTYGTFESDLIDSISSTISGIYGISVVIIKGEPLPQSAFVNIKSPRYRADSLIRIIRREKPDSIDYVLGLTESDISTTKRDKNGNIKKPESKYTDWGIFGLGFRPGASCIVSTFRLKKSVSREKFVERFKKVCVHEIGHNLGLEHCTSDEKCVMRDAAETIKTVDQVDLMLCSNCLSKI